MASKIKTKSSFLSSVSVDCAVFGFDGDDLNVLLVKRGDNSDIYKLPGSLIYEKENIPVAAYRVLENMTGLSSIFLKPLNLFSDPNRISDEDLKWLKEYYNVDATRVITVAYYSLVKLNDRIMSYTQRKGAKWQKVDSIKKLSLDHKEIIMSALSTISNEIIQSPIAFELLPKKFTIRQLQSLYEAILGIELDSRNFRKKIGNLGYLIQTDEKEIGVAHKPAFYYMFDKVKYDKERKNINKISRLYF